MVFDRRARQGHTPSARWIGLASVTDVAAAADAVKKNGGKVVLAPVQLGERGVTAVFTDPEGAFFGVVRSQNGDPLDYVGELNEWVWLDLWAADVDKAAQFYKAVVGYDAVPLEQDGPRRGVQLVTNGYLRAGIMTKQDARITSVWLPYIRVADAAKTAEAANAAGGKVLYAPAQLNRAIVGIIADPTGAPVGIAQLPATPEKQP
jgi:predicted enzyme related to lactoylglutathione lyase